MNVLNRKLHYLKWRVDSFVTEAWRGLEMRKSHKRQDEVSMLSGWASLPASLPNRVKLCFTADRSDHPSVADITYVPTLAGFLLLAPTSRWGAYERVPQRAP